MKSIKLIAASFSLSGFVCHSYGSSLLNVEDWSVQIFSLWVSTKTACETVWSAETYRWWFVCTFSHSVWAVLKWCQCADSRAKSKRDIMLKKQKLNISLSRFLDMYSANAMAVVEVRNSTPTTEEDYLTTWNFICCNGDNESETIKQMLLL